MSETSLWKEVNRPNVQRGSMEANPAGTLWLPPVPLAVRPSNVTLHDGRVSSPPVAGGTTMEVKLPENLGNKR